MNRVLAGLTELRSGHAVFASLLALVAITFDQLEAFRAFDREVQAKGMAEFSLPRDTAPAYLIVDVDAHAAERLGCPPYDSSVLEEVEKALVGLGIRRLILPDGEAVWLSLKTREQSGNILYSAPEMLLPSNGETRFEITTPIKSPRVEPMDAVAAAVTLESGRVVYAPGYVRQAQVDPRRLLPTVLAARVRKDVRSPDSGESVRFFGKAGSVPTLPLTRILSGEFAVQDVNGREALLGISSGRCRPLVPVPTDDLGMSSAEVAVHAASSLLVAPIRHLATWQRALVIYIFTLLVLLGASRIRLGFRIAFAALTVAGWAGLCALLAYYARIVLPVAAPLVAFVFVHVYLSLHNTVYLVRELRMGNAKLARQIETWASPTDGQDSIPAQLNFEYLVDFVRAFVPVNGAYLFSLPLEAFHYKLFLGLGFTQQDIRERRRDTRRMPWLGATSSSSGSQLRGFMHSQNLMAYGLPIFDYGVILGMVVLVLPEGTLVGDRTARMLSRLAAYMGDILLAARAKDAQAQSALWRTLQSVLGRDTLFGEVSHSQAVTAAVSLQLERFRMVLDRTTVGIAVADLLGTIYYQNQSAGDLITRIDPTASRKLLTLLRPSLAAEKREAEEVVEALLLGEEVDLIEWTDVERGRTYHLSLAGIAPVAEGGANTGEAKVSAVLLTINDVTSSKQIDRLKSQVLSLASRRGKSVLEGVRSSLLPREPWELVPEPPALGAGFGSSVEELDNVLESFSRIARKLESPTVRGGEAPFDVGAVTREVVVELEAVAQKREVRLEVSGPESLAPGFGHFELYRKGLRAILEDVLATCYAGHVVHLTLSETAEKVVVQIVDPSALPADTLLEHIDARRYDEMPAGLAQGLMLLERGGLAVKAYAHEEVSMRLAVSVAKA
jgi:PAS domain-containing protein